MTPEERRLETIELKIDELLRCTSKQESLLSTLNERSRQQEKRLDRMDARTASLGAIVGGLAGAVSAYLKTLLPGSHS